MKRVLYLGLDPSNFQTDGELIHYPVIAILASSPSSPKIISAFSKLERATHVVLTSKNAVDIFFRHHAALKGDLETLRDKIFAVVGAATAHALKQRGFEPRLIAEEETQEGLIELLCKEDLDNAFLFYPRSSLARPPLLDFCIAKKISHAAFTLYTTSFQKLDPRPDLNQVQALVFTSPSTVEGFLRIYKNIPIDKDLWVIGPITEAALRRHLPQSKHVAQMRKKV